MKKLLIVPILLLLSTAVGASGIVVSKIKSDGTNIRITVNVDYKMNVTCVGLSKGLAVTSNSGMVSPPSGEVTILNKAVDYALCTPAVDYSRMRRYKM